jgi:hypothetical protein
MESMWRAAREGDLAEVQRLVGHDPGLLDARDGHGMTPLVWAASKEGHVGVVRWLLDQGGGIDERDDDGDTALRLACYNADTPVVRLLLERGADPTIADNEGSTPLMSASLHGHLEVVRSLLGHPGAKAALNERDDNGWTALWAACFYGRGGVVRALLESGADPTIPRNDGITPTAIAKQDSDAGYISVEGRRECVAALEVRYRLRGLLFPCSQPPSWSAGFRRGIHCSMVGRRRSGPTCSGRPGGWPTSRGAARWRWWGARRGRRGRRWWTSHCTG